MRRLTILLLAALLLVSCAAKTPKKAGTPGDLYVEGVNLLKAKKYDQAIRKFSDVRDNYPFDPLAFVATVKLADTYFAKKEYVHAVGIYEEFFTAHPGDENVPYVLSQLGLCYEKLSLTIDRDQTYTLKAVERYTYLRNRYPASSYTKGAEEAIKRMTQKLADRELYVGEFYFRTYQYNAAILRLEYFLRKYPGAKGSDLALYYVANSYKELGDYLRGEQFTDQLKQEYPKSLYARIRTRERKTLQLAKATPTFEYEQIQKRDIDLKPQMLAKAAPERGKEDELSFFDQSKPVDIVSDTMEGSEKDRQIIFKGSVVARQEDLYIFADRIEALTNEANNEIETAHAKGNVKIVKRDRTATSNEAIFDNRTRVVKLKGNVVVFSGSDRVAGELVTYYVNEDKVVVEGEKDKKARVTITPR
jgi:outer membrane protein assembly factor BamD